MIRKALAQIPGPMIGCEANPFEALASGVSESSGFEGVSRADSANQETREWLNLAAEF